MGPRFQGETDQYSPQAPLPPIMCYPTALIRVDVYTILVSGVQTA